ncbi:hypothetical protein JW865_01110 [Candidatus Bathyarchaeota archaeon]|nr:hypothetical protein [Candidatus Bathyarchaeota archaeon]
MYFNTKELAGITICASLWGVVNSIFSPMFFSMFGLPLLCDLIGFSVLVLATLWMRKFGAITMVGLVATVINFTFNPGGIHFLGFTTASIAFDVLTNIVGYNRIFRKSINVVLSLLPISILSAALAGYIIGTFFMVTPALIKWGGVLGWAGLHAIGGTIGGSIGVALVLALMSRRVYVTKEEVLVVRSK